MNKIGVILLFLLVCLGCRIEHTTTELAASQLCRMARVIARLSTQDLAAAEHLSDVLEIAEKKGIITPATKGNISLRDPWGNAYDYRRLEAVNGTVIQIVSNGENGVFEFGQVDDVLLEVTVSKSGHSIATVTAKGNVSRIF